MAFFEDSSTRGYLLSSSPRFASLFPSVKAKPSLDTPMSSPGPSSADIQTHIYNSFLEGKTADVALHVQGSWNAIYKLHRVVLIQAVRKAHCSDVSGAGELTVASNDYRGSSVACLMAGSRSRNRE